MDMNSFESNEGIRSRIDELKVSVKALLSEYADSVKELCRAYAERADKLKKYEKKQTAKNSMALTDVENKICTVTLSVKILNEKLTDAITKVREDWEKLIFQINILDSKATPKEKSAYEKYINDVEGRKRSADDLLAKSGIDIELIPEFEDRTQPVQENYIPEISDAAETAPIDSAEKEQSYTPEFGSQMGEESGIYPEHERAARAGVNLAPVKIDITDMVEKTVAKAMAKFSQVLELKIEKLVSEYSSKPKSSAVADDTSANCVNDAADDLQAAVSSAEQVNKRLAELISQIDEITAGYLQIEKNLTSISESQKKMNEEQRRIAREQQGIAVSQRLVSDEQSKLTEAQKSLSDAAMANLQEQKKAQQAQAASSDAQKAILETQTAIDEAMKALVREQKRLISLQQAVAAENAKQIEASQRMAERQGEITEAAKALAAKQKQLAKEQKAVGDRVLDAESAKKAK